MDCLGTRKLYIGFVVVVERSLAILQVPWIFVSGSGGLDSAYLIRSLDIFAMLSFLRFWGWELSAALDYLSYKSRKKKVVRHLSPYPVVTHSSQCTIPFPY